MCTSLDEWGVSSVEKMNAQAQIEIHIIYLKLSRTSAVLMSLMLFMSLMSLTLMIMSLMLGSSFTGLCNYVEQTRILPLKAVLGPQAAAGMTEK